MLRVRLRPTRRSLAEMRRVARPGRDSQTQVAVATAASSRSGRACAISATRSRASWSERPRSSRAAISAAHRFRCLIARANRPYALPSLVKPQPPFRGRTAAGAYRLARDARITASILRPVEPHAGHGSRLSAGIVADSKSTVPHFAQHTTGIAASTMPSNVAPPNRRPNPSNAGLSQDQSRAKILT